MGVPYEPPPKGGISVPAAVATFVTLDVPSRTRVYKLLVRQVDGDDAEFTVDVYNNEIAAKAAAGLVSNTNEDEDGNTIPTDNYKVTGTFNSTTPGRMEYFADRATGGFGFPFFSQDPPDKYATHNRRKLYLVIITDTSATFAVSVGTDSANF